MEVPAMEFLNAGDDRMRLIGFVRWLRGFLDALVREIGPDVHQKRLFERDIPDEVLKSVIEAWYDLQKQGVFEKAVSYGEKVSLEHLADRGLTGMQLSMKMRVLKWAVDTFGLNQEGGLLRRVLKAIDDVLDSFLGASHAGHALMEFKKALETLAREGR